MIGTHRKLAVSILVVYAFLEANMRGEIGMGGFCIREGMPT